MNDNPKQPAIEKRQNAGEQRRFDDVNAHSILGYISERRP